MIKIKLPVSVLAVIALVGITATTSCKKSLDLNAVGYVTSDQAITNESDLFALLNSGYFAMAEGTYDGGAFQIHNELLADHLSPTSLNNNDYIGIYNRSAIIFNTSVSDLYAQMNKPVYQANLVLDHISLASAANKDLITGQADFMRAFAWFDLVRMFAQPYSTSAASTPGIPLRLNSQRQKISRSSVAEVYQQIITDLKAAETLLPGTNGVLATKWSAKALLAKVYFQMNDFPNAYLYANDVITNGGFVFDTNIFRRFSAAGTTESIFSLVSEPANNRFGTLRGNYNTLATGVTPTLTLTDAFYNRATSVGSDVRNAWYKKRGIFNLLGKFDSTTFNLPVIHLTEIKLIRAESAAETGQNLGVARGDMNDIITRAYGAASSLILPPTADASAIRDAARRERELELVGEGNWLQELKRRGAKGEVLTIRGSVYNCPGLIFPFPTNEIIYLGITQNPAGGCN